MSHRRSFLRRAILGGTAIFSGNAMVFGKSHQDYVLKKDSPIVLSTWDFGRRANAEAWKTLGKKGRALDAVEAGARIIEDDPTITTVGYGGFPDRDGKVTLDSCIMDEFGGCGAVASMENIKNPVSVARLVMEKTPHVMLVGDGARQFAIENGFKRENLLTDVAEKAWKDWLKNAEYKPVMNIENQKSSNGPAAPNMLPGNEFNHDTIGMIAMDAAGNLSGCCTTSGMAFKMHGRVGDSPIIGAGLFVDNEIGAATSTGVGEEVIRICGSHLVVELMRQGRSPGDACREAVERIVRKNPKQAREIQVGFIALNKQGLYGGYALQKGFTYCVQTSATGIREIKAISKY